MNETEVFSRLLGGRWVTAAIGAAASLGLAEALGAPKTTRKLAEELSCDEKSLCRLLNVLEIEGLLEKHEGERYALTSLGNHLRHDEMGSLARFVAAPFAWNPWSSLAPAVRSGRSAFEEHHEEGLFAYLERHPSDAALYHQAIDAFTKAEAQALCAAFDFREVNEVLDLGGGRGSLLIALLSAHSELKGTLFERPAALAQAKQSAQEARVAHRMRLLRGDFFEANAFDELVDKMDIIIIKHVLHNWDDNEATTILRHATRALTSRGKLLVIEGLLLPQGPLSPKTAADTTRRLDLEMLALCGQGRERSKPEMRKLLAGSGLRLRRGAPLTHTSRLMVCEKVTADS